MSADHTEQHVSCDSAGLALREGLLQSSKQAQNHLWAFGWEGSIGSSRVLALLMPAVRRGGRPESDMWTRHVVWGGCGGEEGGLCLRPLCWRLHRPGCCMTIVGMVTCWAECPSVGWLWLKSSAATQNVCRCPVHSQLMLLGSPCSATLALATGRM